MSKEYQQIVKSLQNYLLHNKEEFRFALVKEGEYDLTKIREKLSKDKLFESAHMGFSLTLDRLDQSPLVQEAKEKVKEGLKENAKDGKK